MRVDELETPVPVVNMDRMDANISRLQNYLDEVVCARSDQWDVVWQVAARCTVR